MRSTPVWILAALLGTALAGCNQAQSPDKVQENVAKATDSAVKDDAKAADKLAEADAKGNAEVGSAEAKADDRTTNAAGDAVLTQAEGDHDVAIAKCKALSGQAQKNCKQQADDHLAEVKAKVKSMKDQG